MKFHMFAVCAPGLAAYAAQELHQGGTLRAGKRQTVSVEAGGVSLHGDRAALYRANLHLRTPSRILVRLSDFRAENFGQLRSRAAKLGWEQYLVPGQAVELRVTCHQSRLYHSDAVAERVAAAIGERLGQAPALCVGDEEGDEQPPQLVVVRLVHDVCTISVDASGALLHRRGYRLATAKAPLRETLAAGLVMAAGWPAGDALPPPLLDPFCGSGTIPIEAALMALHVAPGRQRRFAFMAWPDFDADLWQRLLNEADRQAAARTHALDGHLSLFGSDRDAGAIVAAQANARRAGVGNAITFACHALSAIHPPARPGFVVTNPPYGRRVQGGADLRDLYAQLGNVLRQRCPGWQATILSSDRHLLMQTGLSLDASATFVNGGISVTAGRARVPGAFPDV